MSPTASVELPSPAHVSFGRWKLRTWAVLSACCTSLEKSHDVSVVPVSFSAVAILPYSMGIIRGTVPLSLEDCPHPKWPRRDETPYSTHCRCHCLACPRVVELFQVLKSLLEKMYPTLFYLTTSVSKKHLRKRGGAEQLTLILTVISTSPQTMGGDLVTSMTG